MRNSMKDVEVPSFQFGVRILRKVVDCHHKPPLVSLHIVTGSNDHEFSEHLKQAFSKLNKDRVFYYAGSKQKDEVEVLEVHIGDEIVWKSQSV